MNKELEILIESSYKDLVEKHFKDLYVYCYRTGSLVYGGGTLGKSDLDIGIVFKNSIENLSQEQIIGRIEEFIAGYLKIHKQTGYVPDLVFPGEYLTDKMFTDATEGRGFHVKDGKLFLPKVFPGYYLENPERGFRAWLSQSTFNKFLIGNEDVYKKNKINGWNTIIKFILKDTENQKVDIQSILDQLRLFGVHDDYFDFKNIESFWITQSLDRLAGEGFVLKENGFFIPQLTKLQIWESNLAKEIETGLIRRADFFLNTSETGLLAEYADKTWKKMIDIK